MAKHIMLDLETFSSSSRAAIVSIGAVVFDLETYTIGESFKVNVDPRSSQAAGLEIDADTVMWWMHQGEDAVKGLRNPAPLALDIALGMFRNWAFAVAGTGYYVWGNGATFDNVVLRSSYAALGQKAPWHYRKDACYRTMKAMFPIGDVERSGVHHDSRDDAITQAMHLIKIFKHIRGVTDAEQTEVKAEDQVTA